MLFFLSIFVFLKVQSLHLQNDVVPDIQDMQSSPSNSDGGWTTIRVWMGNHDSYGPWSKNDHPGASNSQRAQDQSVMKLFNGKKGGYFVDLAANMAVELSNSRALERDYAWNGLCIEANPVYWSDLAFRKCQVVGAVVGRHTNDTAVLSFSNGPKGGIVSAETDNKGGGGRRRRKGGGAEASRSVISFADLLRANHAPSTIDYLSLDVEGAEDMILENFPFNEYKFLVATVERPSEITQRMLKDNGYVYVKDHGAFGDQMYVHNSFPDFSAALARLDVKLPLALEVVPSTEHLPVNNVLICEDEGDCPQVTIDTNP